MSNINYTYTNLTPFKWYVLENFPFIEEDFDALTNWQLFCKLGKEMNKIINSVNTTGNQVETLTTAFNELQNYVTNYFNNLDVQEEINNKLDEMVQDGTLEQILNKFFTETTGLTFATFQDLKDNVKLAVGNKCKTLGFYTVNDGGEGLYYITDTENTNLPQIKINDTLYANLIFDKNINVKAMGCYGDNIHDDTLTIQSLLNLNYDLYFPTGEYLVSKNEELNFENNDEPCLAIQTKVDKKLIGNNATLISNIHAQGILEIINSTNIIIDSLNFKSIGEFPALDGTTGRGEKGTSTEGYYTSGFWGSKKNNSYDTSNFTTHASINNGQPWGKFQNGFIGNVGSGILIHNGNNNITIKNCKIYGFNFSGISIGFLGDVNVNVDTNIHLLNNTIYNCYNSGINLVIAERYNIENNTIFNIGHPNALYNNANCDPGYGIMQNFNETDCPKKGIISSNQIYNCKRKGIDLHGGAEIIISNNMIDNAFVAGVYAFAVTNKPITQDIAITNNQILNCSYCNNSLSPITIGGQIDASSSDLLQKDVIITNNLLKNCGGNQDGIISCRVGENILINNNIIKDINDLCINNIFAIVVGQTTQLNSKNVNITNNIIECLNNNLVNGGIYCLKANNGVISNNIINIPTGSQVQTTQSNVAVFGNINNSDVVMGLSTQGIQIPYVNDKSTTKKSQIYSALNTLYFNDINGNSNYIPKLISINIIANGTDTPTTQILCGEEFIESVSSITQGLQITLKNLTNKAIAFVNDITATPLTNGSSNIEYKYLRANTNNAIQIGLKATSAGSHIPINTCTGGGINVTILA